MSDEEQAGTRAQPPEASNPLRRKSKRLLKLLCLILLAFVSYHIGWYRAMTYFGADWDTPRGSLSQYVAEESAATTTTLRPSHYLVCSPTLPRRCHDYHCVNGAYLLDAELYVTSGGGDREKKCSDGTIAEDVEVTPH